MNIGVVENPVNKKSHTDKLGYSFAGKRQPMSNTTEMKLRISEVAEQLEKGHSRESIINEFAERWNVNPRTIDRYIAFAKDLVAGKMEKKDVLIEALRADIIAEEAEKWLRSNLEIETRLCAIIEGAVEAQIVYEGKDGEKKVTRRSASVADIIRAIDRLCKIRGMYPQKKEKPKAEQNNDEGY